ncbi:MAG: hypothetical protein HY293_15120 [Planctomycetes bacterium]|nr:hypothetical protein [Planctomycetota bacterium]
MFNWTSVRSGPITEALQRLLAGIPRSRESSSQTPQRRSQTIGNVAALKAAAISGALALPPGPAGFLTLVPDLYLVWRLQGQMVADIASVYGKTACLTPEGMLYCLFKHGAAQALRSVVVRSGQRLLIRRASLDILQTTLRTVGIHLSERLASQAATRWLPVAGSLGVGAFAYRDTARIARTAVDVFESDLSIEDPPRQAAS